MGGIGTIEIVKYSGIRQTASNFDQVLKKLYANILHATLVWLSVV